MSIKTFDVISLGKVNLMNPEQLGYQDSLGIIRDELHRTKRSFVKIGWYLKHILKNEMYKEDGYANIYELASDKFNLSQATATRFMQICEQFSIGHDSPELDEKYIDFNMSQLFEMLPMNQEDMEKVTPGMKVSDIRKFKKENKELSEKKSDEDNIPGQTSIEKDFREFMPDSNQNNADDDVSNGESNVYATSHKENDSCSCSVDLMDKDKIIDGEYREIKAPENEEENPVPLPEDGIAITRYILEQEKKNLDDILKVDKVEKLPEMMVLRQKTIVGALAAMVCDLENAGQKAEVPESEQPELPILKNNDQRKEWINNYENWGLWYRDENIDVNYYKYDFPEGSRLVVAQYPQRQCYWKKNKIEDEHFYHLLQSNKEGYKFRYNEKFRNNTDNETYIVDFLKNLQKIRMKKENE